ncbi:MAG TPA: LysE family translocator [Jatrophihabitantaceae bacterium]
MRSIPEFLIVALLVTVTPGPGTAMIIRVAARDGRRSALGAVAGNSCGVLLWGGLSAVGVSSLILASELAYDVLRIGGAAVLVVLGVRSLLHRGARDDAPSRSGRGWRLGLLTSLANPKLAVFFVALFPQFLSPHAAVLPAALAMAGVIVAFDVIWFSTLTWLVDRAGALLRPRLHRLLERFTGAVLIGLGARLAAEVR